MRKTFKNIGDDWHDWWVSWPGKRVLGRAVYDDPAKMAWESIFPDERKRFLDIGCGKGKVLLDQPMGSAYQYIGIEKQKKYAEYCAKRLCQYTVENSKVLWGFAEDILPTFPAASFEIISLLFPDPWNKDRHKKRRTIRGDFLALLADSLVPNGRLWLVTDHKEYFDEITTALGAHVRFCVDSTLPQENLTHFEVKYRNAGRPIYRSSFCRVA